MWRTHKQETEDLQKAGILIKLRDRGISKVHINFSGSGDSGDIDDVEVEVMFGLSCWHSNFDSTTLTEEESTLVTDLFYEQIDNEACKHGDWVNNEGGYGRFTVCTDTAQFEMDYNQRTVINAFYNGPSIYS